VFPQADEAGIGTGQRVGVSGGKLTRVMEVKRHWEMSGEIRCIFWTVSKVSTSERKWALDPGLDLDPDLPVCSGALLESL
jgi:hypothetical protein